jgi:hypothetical protein
MKLIRWSVHLLIIALVMTLAVAEVSWMGDRVSAQRAARGDHAPGKVITLPLTGLK